MVRRPNGRKDRERRAAARVDCGECGKPAGLVEGRLIYPHRPDLATKPIWRCGSCGAYVGCHPGTTRPLGTPAGPETRTARGKAHAVFDPLWKRKAERDAIPYNQARAEGYAWLSAQLAIDPALCHIGMMSAQDALRVVAVVRSHSKRVGGPGA